MANDILIIDETGTTAAPEVGGDKGTISTHADGTQTMYLHHPIEIKRIAAGGLESRECIDRLTIRRPNGGDIRALQSFTDKMKQTLLVFTRLTGQPELVFDRLDIKDINLFSDVVEGFFPQSQVTGKS